MSCLEIVLLNSIYNEIILKPKQVLCLEILYLEKDVMCVLPTGYEKSLIFHLLPMVLFAKHKLRSDIYGLKSKSISTAVVNCIVIVVSPFNCLMNNQISCLRMSGIQASMIGVKDLRQQHANTSDENIDDDFTVDFVFRLCQEKKLRDGEYQIVFAHPESLVSKREITR